MKNTLFKKIFITMLALGSLPFITSAQSNLLDAQLMSQTHAITRTETKSDRMLLDQRGEGVLGTQLNLDTGLNVDVSTGENINRYNSDDVHREDDDNFSKENNDASYESGIEILSESNTEAELKTFISNVESKDTSVAKVDVNEDTNKVSVRYKHSAKLFSIIPITITSKTTVDEDRKGNLKAHVRLPWWGIFTANKTINTAQAESNINSHLQTHTSARVSPRTKADIINNITAELNSQNSVQVNKS